LKILCLDRNRPFRSRICKEEEDDKIKEYIKMGGVCSTYTGARWLESLKKDHSEDLDVNGTILKFTLNKITLEGVEWRHLSQDIWSSGGLL
jgi:hypothetical protein